MEYKIKIYTSEILENDHYKDTYDVDQIFKTYIEIKNSLLLKDENIDMMEYIEDYMNDLENQEILSHLDHLPEVREIEPWRRPHHISEISYITPYLLKQVLKYDDFLDLDILYSYDSDFCNTNVDNIISEFINELNVKLKNTIFNIFNTF